jgi:D123
METSINKRMSSLSSHATDYVSEGVEPSIHSLSTSEGKDDTIQIIASAAEVWACQVSTWYPVFSKLPLNHSTTKHNKKRSNVTIRSVILDLPDIFIEWMHDDQLILPEGTKLSSILVEEATNQNRSNLESTQSTSVSDDNGEENNDTIDNGRKSSDDNLTIDGKSKESLHSFLDLNQTIENAIDVLYANYDITDESDKAVFPKLNWSSPKDAVWVNNGSMKCCTAGDIYMLLKASDFCSYDMNYIIPDLTVDITSTSSTQEDIHRIVSDGTKEFSFRPKLQLCIKKWCNLYPSQEFRCFIRKQQLIAICQRHDAVHWPHLTEINIQDDYSNLIANFVEDIVEPNIRASEELSMLINYVLDVYIDRKNTVWLVDINVWAHRTDALLFTWSELRHMGTASSADDDTESSYIVFKVIETSKQIRSDPLSSYKTPIDTILMTNTSVDGIKTYGPTEDVPDIVHHNNMDEVPGIFDSQIAFMKFMAMCEKPESDTDDDDIPD